MKKIAIHLATKILQVIRKALLNFITSTSHSGKSNGNVIQLNF